MKFASFLVAALLSLAASAWAQDQAFTSRATDLRDRGASDGKAVASLPADTSVKIIKREGAWTEVEANGQKGWVSAFSLRFPVTTEKSSGGGFSAVTSIFGGSRDSKANVATTGIRGLSPEDLKNANPDPEAVAKMQGYRANKDAAERFAREGRLASVPVDEGGRR
jgi:Bacterial SH3 domain